MFGPNIIGHVSCRNLENQSGFFTASSGSFAYHDGPGEQLTIAVQGTSENGQVLVFDASTASSFYKTNSSVQTKALQTLPCIRY